MRTATVFFSLLVLLALSTTVYGQVDESLVLYLSFDEGAGGTAGDSSLYGFDGKITGAKWVNGKFGEALEFNGVGDFVVPDNPNLLLPDAGTLMAWANISTESGHASWPRIMIKANTNGGTDGYDFLFDRENAYAIRFCIGGVCTSYEAVETDSWHHVAVTYDGKTILVYLDGENVGEGAQAAAAIDTTGSDLQIGNGIAADRAYNGILDEIRIWSRALSEDEIEWNMNKGANEILSVEPRSKLASTWAEIKEK